MKAMELRKKQLKAQKEREEKEALGQEEEEQAAKRVKVDNVEDESPKEEVTEEPVQGVAPSDENAEGLGISDASKGLEHVPKEENQSPHQRIQL